MENEEVVVIDVRYEGNNDLSQVFQLHRDTQWQDLEAMLKVQYDCENVEIFYVDTDGDYITISSQDELEEAFKVSLQCSNTLHLKLRNKNGLPVDQTIERGVNTETQAQGGDNPVGLQPQGNNTDVEIMIESSVDPREGTQGTKEQIVKTKMEEDTSEAELERLEMWLHEDSKAFIKPKESEKIEKADDNITPSKDEKKETGEYKPCDTQRDEETGAVFLKTNVLKQKLRKVDKSGGEHKRRHCRSAERARRHRHENEAGESSDDAAMPYEVFTKYMQQLKQELRTEIVRDVTRKTVKQVLKGLDGAVIQSMKGGTNVTEETVSQSKPDSTSITSPVKNTAQETADPTSSHPVYYHGRVVCDFCERVIVGARYKCCNCADYDLCEECEAVHGVHDTNHVFLKIRRPVHLRNKTPLLKQIIYRTSSNEDIEARQPLHESAERMLKAKMDKLKTQLSQKQDKFKRKEEKMIRKQKRKEERLQQWFEATRSDVSSQVRRATVDLLMAADFLCDVTIPDGTRVQPGTRLMKTWRIRNAGTSKWTSSTKLKVVYDCIPTVEKEVTVPRLRPEEEGEITVELVAPGKPGRYQSHWKMFDRDRSFGHRVWCDIIVEPKEVLEPTKDDTFKVVPQPEHTENVKSEYEKIPEKEVKISHQEDFLLEPHQTSPKSCDEENAEKNLEGQNNDEENIKIVVADSVAEIADKMVEFVCEQIDKQTVEREQQCAPSDGEGSDGKDDEPKSHDTENIHNIDEEKKVENSENIETGDKYESIGRSDESDFSDRQGFLHVRGPDLIAFEMVEPRQEEQEEQFENAEEILNERKEEVQIEERQVLSRSSSVEVVDITHEESTPDEEILNHGYLRSLQNPNTENFEEDDDDDDSLSDSSYDIYNDSEDDFLVVPMPACFNLEKPITFNEPEGQSEVDERGDNFDDNHNMIQGADVQNRVSVDDILTTSGTIATPPLEPEAIATPTPEHEEPVKPKQGLEDIFGPAQEVVTEALPEQNAEVSSTTSMSAMGGGEKQEIRENSVDTDSDETKVIEIKSQQEQNDDEVTSTVITAQPEGATAMEPDEDQHNEHRPAELVNQIMHTAVKAANRAAANAYTTAKEVFYTWQARTYQNASGKTNDYKPPSSSWKPKENSYKPPKSEWRPADDKWAPPKESGPMAKLNEMGFCNRELNQKLLKKHDNDVEAVVQEILATNENNWMEQRH